MWPLKATFCMALKVPRLFRKAFFIEILSNLQTGQKVKIMIN
jgi:hypothetical protein